MKLDLTEKSKLEERIKVQHAIITDVFAKWIEESAANYNSEKENLYVQEYYDAVEASNDLFRKI